MTKMKHLLLPYFLLALLPTFGQKKVDPVTQSAMAGISLPANSRSDKRFLSETGARILLELESKKYGTGIGAVEVLYLPPVSSSGYNSDSLIDQLINLGWNLAPVDGDDKFVWLEKGGQYLMGYFSMDKKESNLYFGVPEQAPSVSFEPMQDPNAGAGQTDSPPQNETLVNNVPVNNEPENNTPVNNTPVISTPDPGTQGQLGSPGNTLQNSGFTETRFDNGWVSTAKEDWVEVVKGNIKVILHYPNPNANSTSSDMADNCGVAWNLLVAPRYSSIQNYQLGPNLLDWEKAYFCQASLTDNQTGQRVLVSLFRKASSVWMEVVTPDEQSFANEFGFTMQTLQNAGLDVWNKIKLMYGYNRFGVKEFELTGLWADRFSSNTFYANIYTGASAGMSTYSSTQEFDFNAPGRYKWSLAAANSYGGQTQFVSVKSEGSFKMLNDWQVWFSDIEKKPKKYDVYFSYIKGAKVLWMNDADYPGSGIFSGYMKK